MPMVDCQRFLDEYTAFRDGELPAREQVAFSAHLDGCAACARYDRVLREGSNLVRSLPALEVSEDFGARLQHRIWHDELDRMDQRRRMRTLRTTGTIAAAAGVAGLAVGASLRDGGEQAPATAHAPGIGGYVVDAPHVEAGRVSSELAQLGIRVYEMPYHDLVYRRDATLVASLAEYTGESLPPPR